MEEFAQVSIARYTDILEQKHILEMRVQQLETHINQIEAFLLKACDKANYDWVTVDKEDIYSLINVEVEDEQ